STAIFDTAFNAPLSGEFNSDALSDLVWRRVIANDPFSANWNLITTADANGDGISDLVYQRPSDGLVEVELIGGATSTGPRWAGGNPVPQRQRSRRWGSDRRQSLWHRL